LPKLECLTINFPGNPWQVTVIDEDRASEFEDCAMPFAAAGLPPCRIPDLLIVLDELQHLSPSLSETMLLEPASLPVGRIVPFNGTATLPGSGRLALGTFKVPNS